MKSIDAVPQLKQLLIAKGIAQPADKLIPLNRGHSQDNYQLLSASSSTSPLFIKHFSTTQPVLDTAEIYKQLAPTNLALPITQAFPEVKLLVQAWFEGIALDQSTLTNSEKIALLTQALLKVHSYDTSLIELPICQLLKEAELTLQASELSIELDQFNIEEITEALTEVSAQPACLCHLDMSFSNLLIASEKPSPTTSIQIIDWEFASKSQPIIDIASSACINRLSALEIRQLCTLYAAQSAISFESLNAALDFSALIASAWYVKKSMENQELEWNKEAQKILHWREYIRE